MLISFRRLQWGLICLLALAAAVMIRPVRSWVDQVIVARAIHPNLSVREIRVHRQQAVVEATEFDWGACRNGRVFGISAEKAWFTVAPVALVDKSIQFPSAKLENARLYLQDQSPTSLMARSPQTRSTAGSIWQQELGRRLEELDWQEVGKHFDSVLKVNQFTRECSTQMHQWIAESTELAALANQIRLDDQSLSNPLRFEDEITAKLQQIDSLVQQDEALVQQFSSSEASLIEETDRLSQVFEEQKEAIQATTLKHTQNTDWERDVAIKLVMAAANDIFHQHRSCAEISALICREAQGKKPASNDFDMRHLPESQPLLALNHLQAVGSFSVQKDRTPFELLAEYRRVQGNDYTERVYSHYQYDFDSAGQPLRVLCSNRIRSADISDVQVQFLSHANSEDSADCEESSHSIQLVIAVDDSQSIEGSLSIDNVLLRYLALQDAELARLLEAQRIAANEQSAPLLPIQLELAGSWETPEWSVVTPLPEWLSQVIHRRVELQFLEAEQNTVAQLEECFEAHFKQMQQELEPIIDEASNAITEHSKQVHTARQRLQSLIEEANRFEFARLPNDAINR